MTLPKIGTRPYRSCFSERSRLCWGTFQPSLSVICPRLVTGIQSPHQHLESPSTVVKLTAWFGSQSPCSIEEEAGTQNRAIIGGLLLPYFSRLLRLPPDSSGVPECLNRFLPSGLQPASLATVFIRKPNDLQFDTMDERRSLTDLLLPTTLFIMN